jgi:putative nucleotidyltransferase with HDIG domain
VSTASTAASAERLSDDAIVELSRSSASQPLERRTWTVLLAGLFLVVAVAFLLLPGQRPVSLGALAVSIACYALASRVQFEFAGGFALPTESVFVVMWFLVPAHLLPLAVCAALVLAAAPEIARGRMPVDRLALSVVSSWFAIGPALVLSAAGVHSPSWRDVPIYVAALAAQFGFDFAASFLVTRAVISISPLGQLRAMAPAFAVDAMLAPLGLVVAFTAYARPWTLLLVLPVLGVFATFARERQQRIDHALELSVAYRGTAILLGDVIEADDAYTGSHSRDVVDLALAVADRLGLAPQERQQVELAALLHDVGKVKIPTEIINKPGPLDEDERAVMMTHTVLGEQMLEQIGGLLGEVGRVVRSCHERWDGAGYPDGIAGNTIPLAARIVCCCDAWSAMTTDRPYRHALPAHEARAELLRCRGTHFDPRVVDALAAVLDT